MSSKRQPPARKPAQQTTPPLTAVPSPEAGVPSTNADAPPADPPPRAEPLMVRDTDLEDIRKAEGEVARQYQEIGKLSEQILSLEAGRMQLCQQRAKLTEETTKAKQRALRRLGLDKVKVRWVADDAGTVTGEVEVVG